MVNVVGVCGGCGVRCGECGECGGCVLSVYILISRLIFLGGQKSLVLEYSSVVKGEKKRGRYILRLKKSGIFLKN